MNRKLFIKNIAFGLAYFSIGSSLFSCEAEDLDDLKQNLNHQEDNKEKPIYVVSKEKIKCKKYFNHNLYKNDNNTSFIILGYLNKNKEYNQVNKKVDIIKLEKNVTFIKFKTPIEVNFPLEKRNKLISYVIVEEIKEINKYKQINI